MSVGDPLPARPRRVIRALVPVLCPPEVEALGAVDDVVDHVAATMGTLPPVFLRGLHAGLVAYDLGALVYPPARGRRAHKLAADVAARYFRSWLHGPTVLHRQLALRILQMMVLAYYEQPAVLEQLGYAPAEWIDHVTRRRLKTYGDDIARAAARVTASDPLAPGRRKERV